MLGSFLGLVPLPWQYLPYPRAITSRTQWLLIGIVSLSSTRGRRQWGAAGGDHPPGDVCSVGLSVRPILHGAFPMQKAPPRARDLPPPLLLIFYTPMHVSRSTDYFSSDKSHCINVARGGTIHLTDSDRSGAALSNSDGRGCSHNYSLADRQYASSGQHGVNNTG